MGLLAGQKATPFIRESVLCVNCGIHFRGRRSFAFPDRPHPLVKTGLGMFIDQVTAAVAVAGYHQLDGIARAIWAAHGAGVMSDADAQACAEAVHARQAATRPDHAPARKISPPATPRRPRRQKSPDRMASIERRRRLAASGPMPPALACKFTTGELAVLKVVADEVRGHGVCSSHIDAIAARAGVCRTTVQNALRMARVLCIVTVHERRRRGQKSLTNVVAIVSAEWRAWLRLAGHGGGFKNSNTTDISPKNKRPERGLDATWRTYYRHYDPKENGRA
jgi:hypothetical protein